MADVPIGSAQLRGPGTSIRLLRLHLQPNVIIFSENGRFCMATYIEYSCHPRHFCCCYLLVTRNSFSSARSTRSFQAAFHSRWGGVHESVRCPELRQLRHRSMFSALLRLWKEGLSSTLRMGQRDANCRVRVAFGSVSRRQTLRHSAEKT